MIGVIQVRDAGGKQFYIPHQSVMAWRGDGSGGTQIYIRGVPWEEQPYVVTESSPDDVHNWWSIAKATEYLARERARVLQDRDEGLRRGSEQNAREHS